MNCVGLDNGVGQGFTGRLRDLFSRDLALDQKAATGPYRPWAGEPQLDGIDGEALAEPIGLTRRGLNLNVPKHQGSL